MSAEYGAINTQDEETPLVSREVETQETCKQKCQRIFHSHRVHIITGWFLVIALTAALTVGAHFAFFKDNTPVDTTPEDVQMQCVSERSWFVSLMLSIFLGPLGVDRFYLGYIFLGILKLITAGLGGIWWTIDVVLIALNVLNDHPNGCHLR
ncbi:uncharacterized protein EV154DRAFT_561249 [Mucor mucedo]|uniref:uncharacterized protein n=1 Tax=Mucor mucedo TaxID=29922 RepID=UPI0022210609|nr:uncharacterized protein EV154DRAFT_561249 [Mucor mucedo]KAI7893503.1 hypothetical protein EV154DRAFT_561249 [Mucor mucedo]